MRRHFADADTHAGGGGPVVVNFQRGKTRLSEGTPNSITWPARELEQPSLVKVVKHSYGIIMG